jgi:hypothetical protein
MKYPYVEYQDNLTVDYDTKLSGHLIQCVSLTYVMYSYSQLLVYIFYLLYLFSAKFLTFFYIYLTILTF